MVQTQFGNETHSNSLVSDNKLNAYRHFGFWQPMDTLRDRNYLESLWEKGDAPWAPEQLMGKS